ncbi:MAG: hypothetical protein AAB250_01765 [Bdellovibrionota bacterium]
MIRQLVLLTLAVLGCVTAEAVPSKSLFVTAVRLLEDSQGPLMYVGYTELDPDPMKRTGTQIVPMEEAVADVLAVLPENEIKECDSRFFRNGRMTYVYSLSNCK